MSAIIEYDEDEAHITNQYALQYYLNMFLDDQYHKHFRDYLKLSKQEFLVTESNMFRAVDEFMDYWKESNTSYEDLYMTAGY